MNSQWSGVYNSGNFSFAEGQFGFSWDNVNGAGFLTFAPVPEPGSLLLVTAVAGWCLARRRPGRNGSFRGT
jgi:hypothetical protein